MSLVDQPVHTVVRGLAAAQTATLTLTSTDSHGVGTAEIHNAPSVYDPGGPAAMVDDFMVATPEMWPTVGRQLLDALTAELRRRGVVVVIAVSGHHDEPKRAMLRDAGLTVASEWYVQALQ
jgi:hypothetical protein